MHYLGGLRGGGIITNGDQTVGRADYDIDGFQTRPGEITGSGEIRATPEVLRAAFGRNGLKLLTDDGRILNLRFTERRLRAEGGSAHVDVAGELPRRSGWAKAASFAS